MQAVFLAATLLTSQMLGRTEAKAATDFHVWTRINLNELISDLKGDGNAI